MHPPPVEAFMAALDRRGMFLRMLPGERVSVEAIVARMLRFALRACMQRGEPPASC